MTDQRKHEQIMTYIEASVHTSTRSREILVLIIIVSVLFFGAAWNSRQSSWINDRITILQATQELVADQIVAVKCKSPDRASLEECAAVRTRLDGRLYAKARKYLEKRHLKSDWATLAAVQETLSRLRGVQAERVLSFGLPFFGAIMDINDLGMLGGFTFVVVLLWFRSSLWHEHENLWTTFDAVGGLDDHDDRQFYYSALSMQQVLTTPPPLMNADDKSGVARDRPKHPGNHWSKAVRALLLLPIAVQLFVFGHDVSSYELGETVSRNNTNVSMVVSGLCLLSLCWLTIVCFRVLGQIASRWTLAANEVTHGRARK